ncbi:Uncharacterized protein APZ42_007736 [Daphnia magna]|uniref:Uncharacterized protein n=1 Tax=Daphnia magna TaxID=35525 RepID=A0A164F4B3_9CRUS|nr:Uncharacterized protein APZ42_007736 [Daphnia magna]
MKNPLEKYSKSKTVDPSLSAFATGLRPMAIRWHFKINVIIFLVWKKKYLKYCMITLYI